MSATFPMVPATGSWVWGLLLLLVVTALGSAVVLLGSSFVGSRHARFEIGDAGLTLRGDVYGRTISGASLRGSDVRVVNLEREPALRPVRRTRGTAVPGYRAGWFRLANGEKALLYLTDTTRVVYVPTTEGYALLLSAVDPSGLAAGIRRIAR